MSPPLEISEDGGFIEFASPNVEQDDLEEGVTDEASPLELTLTGNPEHFRLRPARNQLSLKKHDFYSIFNSKEQCIGNHYIYKIYRNIF